MSDFFIILSVVFVGVVLFGFCRYGVWDVVELVVGV